MSPKDAGGGRDRRISTRYRGISYRQRDDGSRVYYVYADGRHHRVDGDEKEALLVQAELRGKRARGLRVTPVETTFGQLAKEWFENGRARWRLSTRNGYRVALNAHLLPRFGAMSLSAITTDHIAAFIAERKDAGAADSYIAANLRPLNGVFKLALRRRLITANPVAALLPEERPKPARRTRHIWTPDEIRRLLNAARELGARPGNVFDYTTLLLVAIFTGMRIGELLGLRWHDVDFDARVIRVRHQLCRETRTLIAPKTAAGLRDIPIPELLISHLRLYRMASKFSQGECFVFCSKEGNPLDHGNVRTRGFQAAVKLAGLNRPGEPKLTTHDLRHAYASVVAHHGFAPVDLAAFMGHSDVRVTETTYIHPYDQAATATRLRKVVASALRAQLPAPAS